MFIFCANFGGNMDFNSKQERIDYLWEKQKNM